MHRLGGLARIGLRQYETMAEVLMGGLLNFYMQDNWITREQADELEIIYRKGCSSRFHIPSGTARATFYESGVRKHAWGTAVAAFYTHIASRLTDAEDIGRRRAVRSAVARAAATWGCRTDICAWRFEHIRTALQKHVEAAEVRATLYMKYSSF